MTPFLRQVGVALMVALLVVIVMQLLGCAAVDDRYETLRSDCELVPTMGVVVNERGVWDWSVLPEIWCGRSSRDASSLAT